MTSERALLDQAQAYARGFRTPQLPTACPACFCVFAEHLNENNVDALRLRVKCHAFFDALMVYLTTDWTASSRASAARALREAQSRCVQCALHGVTPKDIDFEFTATYRAAALAVAAALGDLQSRTDKGFGSTRGRWPVSADQLFPGGAERAVSALVCLFEADVPAELILADLSGAHRPLAYPVVSNADNRARIMHTVVARARAAEAAMLADLARLGRPAITAVRTAIAERHAKSCALWARMLVVFAYHPDANPGDRPDFFVGYEAALFAPLHALLSHAAPEGATEAYLPVMHLAMNLWVELSVEQCAAAGCLSQPSYICGIVGGLQADLSDPYRALRFFLAQQTMRRECHGPGCGRPVHDKATPGSFAQCAGCRVSRYCSRACQRADWTRKVRPHKAVCAMLGRLFSFADMGMSQEQFSDACRARDFPLDDVELIVEWATDGRATLTDVKSMHSG